MYHIYPRTNAPTNPMLSKKTKLPIGKKCLQCNENHPANHTPHKTSQYPSLSWNVSASNILDGNLAISRSSSSFSSSSCSSSQVRDDGNTGFWNASQSNLIKLFPMLFVVERCFGGEKAGRTGDTDRSRWATSSVWGLGGVNDVESWTWELCTRAQRRGYWAIDGEGTIE